MRIDSIREEYVKADAEGRAKLLAKTYGLSGHQMWKHKQSGKWIISHAGVEVIAAAEGIGVEYTVEYLSPEFVVLRATPYGPDGEAGQATFGEAGANTTQMSYYVAMAEKRAYDRAVLKMALASVGAHGADLYSEEEADDFKSRQVETTTNERRKPNPDLEFPVEFGQFIDNAVGCVTPADALRMKKEIEGRRFKWKDQAAAFAQAIHDVLYAADKDALARVYKKHESALGLDADDLGPAETHMLGMLQMASRNQISRIKEAA